MFSGLWPDFDATDVPITSITNGVHADLGESVGGRGRCSTVVGSTCLRPGGLVAVGWN